MNKNDRRLLNACESGRLATVGKLLSIGVDPDGNADSVTYFFDEDQACEPPLFLACWYGHAKIVELLLEKGANPNVRIWSDRLMMSLDKHERSWYTDACTPAEVACYDGRIDILKILSKWGADLSFVNPKNHSTCLWIALNAKRWDVVAYLVEEAGVDFAKTDKHSSHAYYWTLLDLAPDGVVQWAIGAGIFRGLPRKAYAEYMAIWHLGRGDVEEAIALLKPQGG